MPIRPIPRAGSPAWSRRPRSAWRDEDVASGGAVEHPGQEHHGEVGREAEDQERERRARLADDQDRPTPVAVAQAAEDRTRHELAHRIGREQQADLPAR